MALPTALEKDDAAGDAAAEHVGVGFVDLLQFVGFGDEAFQVEEAAAAEVLAEALGGQGSFRRFKDARHSFPAGRRRERMDAWLREEGILEEGTAGNS